MWSLGPRFDWLVFAWGNPGSTGVSAMIHGYTFYTNLPVASCCCIFQKDIHRVNVQKEGTTLNLVIKHNFPHYSVGIPVCHPHFCDDVLPGTWRVRKKGAFLRCAKPRCFSVDLPEIGRNVMNVTIDDRQTERKRYRDI